jgi:hypothetical protein
MAWFQQLDGPAQDGLASEKDIIVSDGAEVLVVFDVPDSPQRTVMGLFTNNKRSRIHRARTST